MDDLLLQFTLPYPWANLANSSVVSAIAALLLARLLGAGDVRSAAAGVVALVVAGAWTRRGETWHAAAGDALRVATLLAEA